MSWPTKLADGVVGLFSPRRAALRKVWRDPETQRIYSAMLRARSYRAASSSPQKWLQNESAPDSDASDLAAMRKRSAELERDDSIACGLVKTFTDNVIGSRGLEPQVRTQDRTLNDAIESVWHERAGQLHPVDQLTYGQAQRLKFRRALVDGDVLVVASSDPGEPISFEIVEAPRIQTPAGKINDPSIVSGVERDARKRPIAYHVGDYGGEYGGGGKPVRVEAERAHMLRHVLRSGQSRGVSYFHAVLQDIRDLDLLLVASLKRTQIAACLALFIESELPITDLTEATEQTYGYKLDQAIEPGMIFKLFPGEKVSSLLPNFPVPELVPFTVAIARRIGVALGVSWQTLLRDFSQSNYSSARTTLLDDRRTFQALQEWFIPLLDWEWAQVMADARLRGDPRLANVDDAAIRSVRWVAQGWQWVDPQKEALAIQLELQLGTTTLRDVCQSMGKDWEQITSQRVEEAALLKQMRLEAGLKPSDMLGFAGQRLTARATVGEEVPELEMEEGWEQVQDRRQTREQRFRQQRDKLGLPPRYTLDEWRYAVTTRGQIEAEEELSPEEPADPDEAADFATSETDDEEPANED